MNNLLLTVRGSYRTKRHVRDPDQRFPDPGPDRFRLLRRRPMPRQFLLLAAAALLAALPASATVFVSPGQPNVDQAVTFQPDRSRAGQPSPARSSGASATGPPPQARPSSKNVRVGRNLRRQCPVHDLFGNVARPGRGQREHDRHRGRAPADRQSDAGPDARPARFLPWPKISYPPPSMEFRRWHAPPSSAGTSASHAYAPHQEFFWSRPRISAARACRRSHRHLDRRRHFQTKAHHLHHPTGGRFLR